MQMINTIIKMGPSILMPMIFFFISIIIRMKVSTALKASLLIGVGFTGLNMSINLLLDQLGPATKAMISALGVNLTTVDTGWAVTSQIGWGSKIMPFAVVTFLVINGIMFALKLTKTIDIDVFNYWAFLAIGATIYAVTKSIFISVTVIDILFAVVLVIADITAPKIQKVFGVQGLSFPHLTNIIYILFGIIVTKCIDKIPGISKMEIRPETINKRFGSLGDPVVIGFLLGVVMGVLARYNVSKLLLLAISVASVMVLIPKMIDILLMGLNIVRGNIEIAVKHRFPNRKINIGMDIALLAGDASIIASGLLLIPINLVLAVILPGNRVLPFADLPSLFLLLPMLSAYCRKDMFRMIVTGTIISILILYIGTDISNVYTTAAHMSNVHVPNAFDQISGLNNSNVSPIGWIIYKLSYIFG